MPHENAITVAARPSVVVVIPFYNGADFIERSVKSVFNQTVPAHEVIVVNDGSRPEEREALGALAARYPFRIVDKENGGQGSARNAGVAASSADFLCFLDQDDFYLPNHIEILVDGIPAGDARFGFVYADLYEADVDGNVVRTSLVKEHAKNHPKRSIFDLLRYDMFVLPSAALVSRVAFDAVGGFDGQFMGYEDDDLFLRIFRKGYSNHFIDRAVTVWCIHTESTSFGIRMIRSRFRYFKKLIAMFPDEPRRGRFYFRDQLVPRFGKFFVDHAIEAIKLDNEYRGEMFAYLSEYTDMVLANPYMGRRRKVKLWITRFLLSHSTPGIVRAIGSATKLPLIRGFRKIYKTEA
ncbi:glycosyltransferase family 2 protein [Variovorax fucosicus]|uniref:glycosyltransferase family 2 protein n=1 Tax=Variovorax fucosicus TaxID=3053517 RepID=UPI0025786753|nr:glycosyltransferase family A protein [Variovorax sp. J22G47]MDM0055823.1 glycosyltransferase family A protein [Variovorax sp. J22G47]